MILYHFINSFSVGKSFTIVIKNERGNHFDPHLVDIFFENHNEFIEIKNKYTESIKNESVTIG